MGSKLPRSREVIRVFVRMDEDRVDSQDLVILICNLQLCASSYNSTLCIWVAVQLVGCTYNVPI
jgi:hypothetical protein